MSRIIVNFVLTCVQVNDARYHAAFICGAVWLQNQAVCHRCGAGMCRCVGGCGKCVFVCVCMFANVGVGVTQCICLIFALFDFCTCTTYINQLPCSHSLLWKALRLFKNLCFRNDCYYLRERFTNHSPPDLYNLVGGGGGGGRFMGLNSLHPLFIGGGGLSIQYTLIIPHRAIQLTTGGSLI